MCAAEDPRSRFRPECRCPGSFVMGPSGRGCLCFLTPPWTSGHCSGPNLWSRLWRPCMILDTIERDQKGRSAQSGCRSDQLLAWTCCKFYGAWKVPKLALYVPGTAPSAERSPPFNDRTTSRQLLWKPNARALSHSSGPNPA